MVVIIALLWIIVLVSNDFLLRKLDKEEQKRYEDKPYYRYGEYYNYYRKRRR